MNQNGKQKLSLDEVESLLHLLRERFEVNINRHKGIKWGKVEEKLRSNSSKLWSLYQMENTGGEPDIVRFGNDTGEYFFVDCSKESPKGRRSLCYDQSALLSRKEFKPKDSAVNMAEEMKAKLLNEMEYRELQRYGEFDTKTSSWIETPGSIRKLGGALFADRRYENVFVYHNGAESYYMSRGFRVLVTL